MKIAKEQFHQNSYKTESPEKSDVKINEIQKNQPSLHIKKPQKQQLTASKTFKTKSCKGVDGVLKFTTNPYKRFRSRKIEACGTRCVKKLCNYHQS